MKKSKSVKIYMTEDMAKKLAVTAKGEGMSVSNLMVFLARQKISYFERVKGNITKEQITSASLEQFEEE